MEEVSVGYPTKPNPLSPHGPAALGEVKASALRCQVCSRKILS